MESFLRIWSIIVMIFLLIASTLVAFDKNKMNKGGIILLIMLVPTFVYIIKY